MPTTRHQCPYCFRRAIFFQVEGHAWVNTDSSRTGVAGCPLTIPTTLEIGNPCTRTPSTATIMSPTAICSATEEVNDNV
eukprot:340766-Rhodomonas_salina.2